MNSRICADDAAVDLNDIKTFLANGLSTFPTNGNPVFSNGPKSLTKIPPDCPILCNQVSDNFLLADEPFAKVLRSFKNCVLIYNNFLREIILISLFHSRNFFIPDFNLLIYELNRCYIEPFFIRAKIKLEWCGSSL